MSCSKSSSSPLPLAPVLAQLAALVFVLVQVVVFAAALVLALVLVLDQASAVTVLHGLHSMVDLSDQEVDVTQEDGHISVVARTAISEKTLSLPPCVPRTPKVYDKSEHPYMAHIQVQVLGTPKKIIN